MFGRRRAGTRSSAVEANPVLPAQRQPVFEDNVVVLMRGVDEELAGVAAEALPAVEAFLASLRANSRPEGRITVQNGAAVEQYKIVIDGYQITWMLGPSIRGKVLITRIFKVS